MDGLAFLLALLPLLLALVATGVGAYCGIRLFPAGTYPVVALALPGLLCGVAVFFVVTFLVARVFGALPFFKARAQENQLERVKRRAERRANARARAGDKPTDA